MKNHSAIIYSLAIFLQVSGYSGDAGDSLSGIDLDLNNMPFTTRDNDNDHRDDINCAVKFYGKNTLVLQIISLIAQPKFMQYPRVLCPNRHSHLERTMG